MPAGFVLSAKPRVTAQVDSGFTGMVTSEPAEVLTESQVPSSVQFVDSRGESADPFGQESAEVEISELGSKDGLYNVSARSTQRFARCTRQMSQKPCCVCLLSHEARQSPWRCPCPREQSARSHCGLLQGGSLEATNEEISSISGGEDLEYDDDPKDADWR